VSASYTYKCHSQYSDIKYPTCINGGNESFANKEKYEHYIASCFGAGAYNYIRTNIENIDKGDRQTKLVRLLRTAKRGDEHPQSLYVANSANCDRTESIVWDGKIIFLSVKIWWLATPDIFLIYLILETHNCCFIFCRQIFILDVDILLIKASNTKHQCTRRQQRKAK
jgi:hypothetical protein